LSSFTEARIALRFEDPLQLLVAVVLSAQCTDVRVNETTPALFARYRRLEDYATADARELESYLRRVGLFRAKARALIGAARAIVERYGGQVPVRRQELAELPGVGNKSAGVIAMHLSGEPALPVDTHVTRLAHRLGLSSAPAPDRIEADLRSLLPVESWHTAHHVLVWHGRTLCVARGPHCSICPVETLCPKRGVPPSQRR
jgi:endonuclease-3